MHHKRRRPRKQVRCTLCTDNRENIGGDRRRREQELPEALRHVPGASGKRRDSKMKLEATEQNNGARELVVDFGDSKPSQDSARLIEAAHHWMWEPFERLQKERKRSDPKS